MPSALRILRWGMAVGFVCFSVGFFGPILWAPDANQGPLLGIFITGPIGFGLGLGIGIYMEARRAVSSPSASAAAARTVEAPASPGPRLDMSERIAHPTSRLVIGTIATILLVEGFTAVGHERGRGPASAIAIGVVAALIAVKGRLPSWFRR